MKTLYAGLDPGMSGAFAVIGIKGTDGRNFFHFSHQGIAKSDHLGIMDINDYVNSLPSARDYGADRVIVFIEQCMVLARQGGAAKIGVNWGICYGAVSWAYGEQNIRITHPRVWKAHVFGEGQHDKEESIAKAHSMGYDIPTLRPAGHVLDDNVAEALLLATYGREVIENV